MGFWGSYVAARTPGSLAALDAMARCSDGLDDERRYGAWVIGRWSSREIQDEGPDLAGRLAVETGSPTLVAQVRDGAAAVLDGWSESTGPWRNCLGRSAMRRQLNHLSEQAFEAQFPPPDRLVADLLAWAVEAGSEPDRDAVRRLAEAEHGAGVEPVLTDLLRQLGVLAASGGDTLPAGAADDRRPAPPAEPYDARPDTGADGWPALLAGRLDEVLVPRGFRRDGVAHRRSNDLGDELVVQVTPAPAVGHDLVFSVDTAILPAMLLSLPRHLATGAGEHDPRDARSGWCRRRIAPPFRFRHATTHDGPDADLWRAAQPDEGLAAALTSCVDRTLVNLLPLLDRDRLLTRLTLDGLPGRERRDSGHPLFTEILLRLDRDAPDVCRDLIGAARADPALAADPAFLDWADAELSAREARSGAVH